jgi:hypothetical protein
MYGGESTIMRVRLLIGSVLEFALSYENYIVVMG